MKRKTKFSKGTGHFFTLILLIIGVIMLIISKVSNADSELQYEIARYAAYPLILAIGIELGMEIAIQEDGDM